MPFVLDNSVVAGWIFSDQARPYTETIAQRLLADTAWAPAIWELELTNVLRSACLRQRLDAQRAQQALAIVSILPIEVDRQAVARSELLALALRFGLSTYDAAHLELALRKQLPLATKDAMLAEAALAAGVGVVAGA